MFKLKIDPEKIIDYENSRRAEVNKYYIVINRKALGTLEREKTELELELAKDFSFARLYGIDHDDEDLTFKVGLSIFNDEERSSWCRCALYPIEELNYSFNKISQKERLEIIKKLREGKDLSIFA